ncbi:MAG: hypothetical protein KDB79_10030 [Acidobacteria bacterium]|nr:hypothetical protein [Acidobacteriota bacterium]
MRKLAVLTILLFSFLGLVETANAQCEGHVYITSLSLQSENSVQGFTSTELDYCAGLYYDPANNGSFVENYGSGSAILRTGYTQGYGDSVPAELNFFSLAPVNNGSYTTNGNHYVVAYYQVYVPVYYGYYWYDPFGFGFSEGAGGSDVYYSPDDYGYWGYATYWMESPQYVGTTSDTVTYTGQTLCLPGQQFTSSGQACSSLPGCESGLAFSNTGEICPGYVPPVEAPNSVAVAVVFDDDILPPKKTTGYHTARVSACISTPGYQQGLPVAMFLEAIDEDTGHDKNFHTGTRPLGTLRESKGATDSNGCFTTIYYPPYFSGKIRARAIISGVSGEAVAWVLVENLARLEKGDNYRLNGSGSAVDCDAPECTAAYMSNPLRRAHPSNHWVKIDAIPALVSIANDYKRAFYGSGYIPPAEMITYNDASLRWGGKFDLGRKWLNTGAHLEHREGTNVDTKTLNIPTYRQDALLQILRQNNFGFNDERRSSAPHLHIRWNDLRETGASNVLENGIDTGANSNAGVSVTTSELLGNAVETAFDRPISQGDFESWYPPLSGARSQGANAFLQEVKTLFRQFFASQEYVLRSRTDAEFISDVFASHLFREPTDQEISHWTTYLYDLGGGAAAGLNDPGVEPANPKTRIGSPSLGFSQEQKRQMFLNYFQTLPQFILKTEQIVNDP